MASFRALLERAAALVQIRETGRTVIASLVINRGFRDGVERDGKHGGGVDPDARETFVAEEAIARAFLDALGDSPLSLGSWFSQQAAARGGMRQLAADLLGLPLNRETRSRKDFKAEVRAVERYVKGDQQAAPRSKERIERIRSLQGHGAQAGNPLLSAGERMAGAVSRLRMIVLGVQADWLVSAQKDEHQWKRTDPEPASGANAQVIQDNGTGLITTVEQWIGFVSGAETTVERCFGVQIQAVRTGGSHGSV